MIYISKKIHLYTLCAQKLNCVNVLWAQINAQYEIFTMPKWKDNTKVSKTKLFEIL